MAVPTYSWNTINTSQTDADSPLDTVLMEAMRQNLIHCEEWIGDGYTAAKDHDHDNVNSKAVASVASGAIHQAQLAAAAGSILSHSDTPTSKTMSGGLYSFFPQIKKSVATGSVSCSIAFASYDSPCEGDGPCNSTSYITHVALGRTGSSGQSITAYLQNYYIQSSGNTHWIFILLNTQTGLIESIWEAPDHPCYGQGADETVLMHPHLDQLFDPDTYPNHQIMLVDNDELGALKTKRKANLSICEIIEKQYDIDISPVKPKYKDREIIEIDNYDERAGEVLDDYGNGRKRKRRIVTGLPAMIEYRALKKK